jgi:hypothetical protein
MILAQYPEPIIQLFREVQNHPDLQMQVNLLQPPEFEIKFAYICAHLNIALNDTYTEEDICKICDIAIERLKAKRIQIIH